MDLHRSYLSILMRIWPLLLAGRLRCFRRPWHGPGSTSKWCGIYELFVCHSLLCVTKGIWEQTKNENECTVTTLDGSISALQPCMAKTIRYEHVTFCNYKLLCQHRTNFNENQQALTGLAHNWNGTAYGGCRFVLEMKLGAAKSENKPQHVGESKENFTIWSVNITLRKIIVAVSLVPRGAHQHHKHAQKC